MSQTCVSCGTPSAVEGAYCGPCAKRGRERQHRSGKRPRTAAKNSRQQRSTKEVAKAHARRLRPCLACRADWAMPGKELCIDCDALLSGKPYFSI